MMTGVEKEKGKEVVKIISSLECNDFDYFFWAWWKLKTKRRRKRRKKLAMVASIFFFNLMVKL
jgi:hypothetical protein